MSNQYIVHKNSEYGRLLKNNSQLGQTMLELRNWEQYQSCLPAKWASEVHIRVVFSCIPLHWGTTFSVGAPQQLIAPHILMHLKQVEPEWGLAGFIRS
jgi:hypothetical protein